MLASSLELHKHKREKRDCNTESVCGAKKLQGLKLQGAKNPTPLHKAKLPTASVRGIVQRQFGTPTQARRVDGHVASRKHQSLHANPNWRSSRGRNSPPNISVNSMKHYTLPNSLARGKKLIKSRATAHNGPNPRTYMAVTFETKLIDLYAAVDDGACQFRCQCDEGGTVCACGQPYPNLWGGGRL